MSILEPFSMYRTVNLTKGGNEMMGRVKFSFLVMVLLFTQCEEEKKPEGLLDRDEMVNLMVDMYLAEAKITISRIPRDSARKLFAPFEEAELTSRGLSDSTLKANYEYYLQRPKELEQILDAVIDTLNLREQRIGGQR